MKLPFAGQIPAHYYSDSLTRLESFLSERDSEGMISIKLRPISKWPVSTDSEFSNAYMYPAEYKELSSYLEDRRLVSSTEYQVTVCKVDEKDEFLVVEHETGADCGDAGRYNSIAQSCKRVNFTHKGYYRDYR